MHATQLCRSALSFLASIALACALVPAAAFAADQAERFTEGGITYTVQADGGTVKVGAQSGSGSTFAGTGAVSVPASVTHDGVAYAVKGVEGYAFSDGQNGASVTSLTIADGVQEIGQYAFAGCTGIKSLRIPKTVTAIDRFAFAGCTGLETLQFDEPDADSPVLTCGQNAFAGTGNGDSLAEVQLPKRLAAVSSSMFQRQTALKKLSFAGDAIGSIGQYAFNGCTALEDIEIPQLTKAGKMGTRAFFYVPSAKRVVFKGDIDYDLASEFLGIEIIGHSVSYNISTDVYSYPELESVVFNGTRAGYTLSDAFDSAAQYQRIDFYASRSVASPASSALVRTGVPAKDIGASLPADSIYSGSIPQLANGQAWYFEGVPVISSVPDSWKAYAVDKNDLSYGSLVLKQDEFATISKPVTLSYDVYAVDGTKLPEASVDVSVENEMGTRVALDSIADPGTYTITAKSTAAPYSGSVSNTFTVERATSKWTRLDGNAYYAVTPHAVSAAFDREKTDTAILVPKSAVEESTTLAALAGALHAPIIVTNDSIAGVVNASKDAGHLNAEARASLASLNPDKVLLVGYTRDQRDGAQAFVEAALPNATHPTFSNTSSTASDAAYNVWRTTSRANTTGIKVEYGPTAIVASAADISRAWSIMPYAYKTASAMFLVEDAKTISASVTKAVAGGTFDRVIVVGPTSSVASSVEKKISDAGFAGSVERWGDSSDAYAASIDIARKAADEGVVGYDKIALVSAKDPAGALTAGTVCGENAAPLVLAANTAKGRAVIDSVLSENAGVIEQGYIVGTRSVFPEALADAVRAVWGAGDDASLSSAALKPSATAFTYDAKGHLPAVSVTGADGELLTEGMDYTLRFYDNESDRQLGADGAVEPGTYTVVANGMGAYSGSVSSEFDVVMKKGVTFKVGSVSYKALSSTAAAVTKVPASTKGSVTIPATVKGLSVTQVAKNAFKGCKNVTKATLSSKKLTSIGARAFYNCTKLKTLAFKSSKITKASTKAFAKVNAKCAVKVPSGKVKSYKNMFVKAGLAKGSQVVKG